MRKYMLLFMLFCLHHVARGQTTFDYEYWFDNDRTMLNSGSSTTPSLQMEANVENLLDGFHTFHVHVRNIEGVLSSPVTRFFIKQPQTAGEAYITLLCIIDGTLYKQERVANIGGSLLWEFDISSLKQGLHQIQVLGVTPSGAATSSYSTFFLRTATANEIADMKFYYYIDNENFSMAEAQYVNGGFHFDLDVSQLTDGLHRLAYFMSDGKGTMTKVTSQFFWKTPVGGNGIVEYCYWLNERSSEEGIHVVQLAERPNPFSLMTLLPVESVPIRSSCFEFRVNNGLPVIYAKNDFHLRFTEATGRFTDILKQYVDEQMGQAVTDLTLLTPGVRATTDRPVENAIKWYKLTAEAGDSLSFQLDRAATVQLFSPTGKEVYSASGAEAVKWGGLHAEENGTYYLALHDVTATSGSTVSIDYQHIDRYAVLRQDILAVGNGGPSTITFQGNGFDELTSVDLQLGSTVIASTKIETEGKATVSVKWDFSEATLGQYKAVFHFAEGDVTVDNCVTVEEATPFYFEETASFASQYLRSTSNTYVFKIRNYSNMTAYNVPLAIHIYSPDGESLKKVKIGGYDVKEHFVSLFGEEGKERAEAIVKKNEDGGDLYYFLEDDETEYVESHPYLHHAFICPDLRPNTTETITVSIQSDQMAYVYMWYPVEWESENVPNASRGMRKSVKDGICAIANERARQCEENRRMEENGLSPIYNVDCDNLPQPDNCPPPNGGPSGPVNSLDPNDIYGYQDEYGSKVIRGGLTDVYYTIEFENDPEFATAAAHDIYVSDQLDAQLFDLSTFSPTRIQIGDQEVMLTDENRADQVVTIDLRPRINAIAQVEWSFDATTGLAEWHISSLDPMTNEPTTVAMDGVLPVNNGGNGIGQLSFDISLKPGLPIDTEIPNSATIVFDTNEPIVTPTWVNTIGEAIMMGDVNGDGEINTVDASYILMYLVGRTPADFVEGAADVDGSGEIDTLDATAILKKLVE